MDHVREIRAVVLRKAQGVIGCRIGEKYARGPISYLLEIQEDNDSKITTISLDLKRSKDFYRIPTGKPLVLRLVRYGTRIGQWLESWRTEDDGG